MGYPHLPFPSPPPPLHPLPTPLHPITPHISQYSCPTSFPSPFHFLCNFSFPWSSDVPPSFHLFPVFFSVLSPFRSPPICSSKFITSPVIWGYSVLSFFPSPPMFLHLLSPVLQCSAVLSDFFFPSPPIFLRPFSFPQSSYVPPLFLLSPSPSPPMLLKTSPFPIVLLCSPVLSPFASPPMFLSSFSFPQSSYVP